MRTRSIPLMGLLSAEFLSLTGNQIAAVAIPLLVLEYTRSPLVTGLAVAGNVLPVIFAAFIGGRVIDSIGAVRASIWADLMSGVSVLVLPLVLVHFSAVSPFVLFFLVLLGALFDPTGVSARQTLVPSLARLSGTSLDKVNGYRGALENGADLLGPVLGGGLIALIGAVNTFFFNAASFFLCAILLALSIPGKRRPVTNHERHAVFEGARFVFKDRQLKTLAFVGMTAGFVVLPFLGLLLPVLTTQRFESPVLLGMCLAVFGLAATGGALFFPRLTRLTSRTVIFYGGLLLTALSIIGCAFVETSYGLLLCVALSGLLLGAGNPLEQTILHEQVPPRIAGQVFTAHTAVRFAAGPFGLLLAGLAVEYATVERVLIIGGGVLLVTAVAGWWAAPLSAKPKRR